MSCVVDPHLCVDTVSSLPTATSVALPSGLREREQLYALLVRETYQIVRMHESFTVASARKLHVHRGNHTKASLRHAHESFTAARARKLSPWRMHESFTAARARKFHRVARAHESLTVASAQG